ncbi:MAG: WD40/YVTN/BNR-like repeat-containing protein [Gemmatimonadales bacterium]
MLRRVRWCLVVGPVITVVPLSAQQFDSVLTEMHWRNIGPFRGGRTKSAAGVPTQPNVFYIGVTNGGVWKTTDYGNTWKPIFDDQPTGSIGAIAVAPSDPDILYVGSGEGLQRPDLSTGDGIYKSTDAGHSWSHLGLRDGQQIPQIAVDPGNPDRLFVAVLGHPYGPNEQRGIYRSLDGGRSFQKVLGRDENTGGIDVAFEPGNSQVVYAALWEARQGPWENSVWSGPGSGLFKSVDGGTTWRQLTTGLPAAPDSVGVGRIGIGISASNPKRIFAAVEAGGLYRSDDAGETWTRITNDDRVVARGSDMAEVKVDPENQDLVYTASIVSWRSTDGGRTWKALRGAPGGDDYQRFWINPINPDIMLLVSDQGASVTVNGGTTWSSWYNQPTAQFYHVTADNAFPYRLCGGQQESGSACVASRGNDGRITFREWHPVGIEEYGYAAPDPLDPDVVFGGKVSRYDRRTGQVQAVPPPVGSGYRAVRTAPLVFSAIDKHALYFGQNVVWKTVNGGSSWTRISPDLTRTTWQIPASVGIYRTRQSSQPTQRGVIYTLAPSYVDAGTLWAGTDDGLIQVTRDGGMSWHDVTPPGLTPWAKVSLIDAGRFDAATAYAAVNTIRLDDLHPHLYRTHDGGKTWTGIDAGIPAGETANAIREDTRRRGMLFATTERTVYVSLDDGDHWQSLRLNLPVTSIRDLVIKDDDLAIATHGRGFWILDDISPLRQWNGAITPDAVQLFQPADAWRVRWNTNTDTPLPPDEPAGENPPEGAIIDYRLGAPATGVVTLEISDSAGRVARTWSSDDQPLPIGDIGNTPGYWMRPTPILSGRAGFHRFVWDEHLGPPPDAVTASYPMSATPFNTAPSPGGPWVNPGRYHVKLTVDGHSYSRTLRVKMDPRVKTPAPALRQQYSLSLAMYDGAAAVRRAQDQIRALRASVAARCERADAPTRATLATLDSELAAIAGAAGGSGRGGRRGGATVLPCGDRVRPPTNTAGTFGGVAARMRSVLASLQGSDMAPTLTMVRAATDAKAELDTLLLKWQALRAKAGQ